MEGSSADTDSSYTSNWIHIWHRGLSYLMNVGHVDSFKFKVSLRQFCCCQLDRRLIRSRKNSPIWTRNCFQHPTWCISSNVSHRSAHQSITPEGCMLHLLMCIQFLLSIHLLLRMPCGRILKRCIYSESSGWRLTVGHIDPDITTEHHTLTSGNYFVLLYYRLFAVSMRSDLYSAQKFFRLKFSFLDSKNSSKVSRQRKTLNSVNENLRDKKIWKDLIVITWSDPTRANRLITRIWIWFLIEETLARLVTTIKPNTLVRKICKVTLSYQGAILKSFEDWESLGWNWSHIRAGTYQSGEMISQENIDKDYHCYHASN